MHALRQVGLRAALLAKVCANTVRLRLPKIGGATVTVIHGHDVRVIVPFISVE